MIDLDKALTYLLSKARSDTKAKSAGAKVLRYPVDGDYTINDIRILAVSVSFEYKTWTVEIAVKKDDESSHQMKRFKLTIAQEKVPLWQEVQKLHMERICNFDFECDFDVDEPTLETYPNNDGFSIGSTGVTDVSEKVALILSSETDDCDHHWSDPFDDNAVCNKCGVVKSNR